MNFKRIPATSDNSVFAVRFAHENAFGTSQARTTLGEINLKPNIPMPYPK